jgi:hypothetical protein
MPQSYQPSDGTLKSPDGPSRHAPMPSTALGEFDGMAVGVMDGTEVAYQ